MSQPLADCSTNVESEKENPAVDVYSAAEPRSNYQHIDGGLRGWGTVLGSFLVQFCMIGAITSFGVTEAFYAVHFLTSKTPSEINWVGSLQLFLGYTLGIFSGQLLDAGYFHVISITGSTLFLFSMFMLSLAKPEQYYQVLLSQGIGMGIGIGIVYLPSSSIVANHFTRRRGLAMGIITAGSSIGGFFFSTVLNHFFSGKIGFANGIRIAAFVCLGCFVVANLTMRVQPARPKPTAPQTDSNATSIADVARPPPLKDLIRQPSYMLTIAYGFVIQLGLYFPMFSVQLFAHDHPNIPHDVTSWLIATINLSSTIGRVIPNWLSDKVGALEMIIPCVTITAILSSVMVVCTTSASLLVFCVLYGFFSGAVIALYFPVVLAIDPNVKSSGIRLGLACVPPGLASLIGSPLATALVGSHRWWAGCVFAGVVQLFAAGLLCIAYYLLKR